MSDQEEQSVPKQAPDQAESGQEELAQGESAQGKLPQDETIEPQSLDNGWQMPEPNAIQRAVEAALFAAGEPLSPAELRKRIGEDADVRAALRQLQADYQGRGIELVDRGGRWHFQTAPDLAWLLRQQAEQLRKLSRAATETLAIIAYHEPVSRAEIQAIRGVQVSKGTLDVLMEEGWIKPAGRREAPGRPLIYATTPEFLSHFGLASRRDLPGIDDLRAAGLLEPVDLALEQQLADHGDIDEEEDEDQDGQGEGEDDAGDDLDNLG